VVVRVGKHNLPVAFGLELVCDRGAKTLPAGSTLLLGNRIEQQQKTRGADKRASVFLIVERTAVRPFRVFREQHLVCLGGQEQAPFVQWSAELGEALAQPAGRRRADGR